MIDNPLPKYSEGVTIRMHLPCRPPITGRYLTKDLSSEIHLCIGAEAMIPTDCSQPVAEYVRGLRQA